MSRVERARVFRTYFTRPKSIPSSFSKNVIRAYAVARSNLGNELSVKIMALQNSRILSKMVHYLDSRGLPLIVGWPSRVSMSVASELIEIRAFPE